MYAQKSEATKKPQCDCYRIFALHLVYLPSASCGTGTACSPSHNQLKLWQCFLMFVVCRLPIGIGLCVPLFFISLCCCCCYSHAKTQKGKKDFYDANPDQKPEMPVFMPPLDAMGHPVSTVGHPGMGHAGMPPHDPRYQGGYGHPNR